MTAPPIGPAQASSPNGGGITSDALPAAVTIPTDHPAFAGHFPGQPLLPGVSLLAEVLEALLDRPALAAQLGPAPRLAAVKFLAPVRPGAQLVIDFDAGERSLRFEVREGERVCAAGQFEVAR